MLLCESFYWDYTFTLGCRFSPCEFIMIFSHGWIEDKITSTSRYKNKEVTVDDIEGLFEYLIFSWNQVFHIVHYIVKCTC